MSIETHRLPIVLPIGARILLGLRIALSAAFAAWLLGVAAILLWALLVAPGGDRPPLPDALKAALAIGFYSGVVVLPCALLLVWPACCLALKANRFPLWLGALVGLACGALVAVATVSGPPNPWWLGLAAAYGGAIGGAAAWLGHRWIPRAPVSRPEAGNSESPQPTPI